MPERSFSVTETRAAGTRIALIGTVAVVAILGLAAVFLFLNLPDANAFNARVERIFVENDLTSAAEIKLLEILAQSGTAFSDTLASYRVVIFVLLVFATAMLVAALGLLAACSSSAPDADGARSEPSADAAEQPAKRPPTVLDDQLKALDKAKSVEATLKQEQADRDKAIEDAGG